MFLASLPVSLRAESVAGLKWTAPAGWKAEGARPMRAATYSVPAAAGDKDNGECVVYFFGAGQGGGVQANIDRWKGQFKGPDGKPPAAKTGKKTVNGLAVTTVEVAGEYMGMGGPMAASKGAAAGYRMLGAIIENAGGNIFLKFTAPAKTVAANQQKFDQLVNSFQKQ
ncbi:MAG: hypothetical protein HY820_30360 [Acidobacteria bacterium]|nr:hypothetical protein [Acidobacteriota bacterium]